MQFLGPACWKCPEYTSRSMLRAFSKSPSAPCVVRKIGRRKRRLVSKKPRGVRRSLAVATQNDSRGTARSRRARRRNQRSKMRWIYGEALYIRRSRHARRVSRGRKYARGVERIARRVLGGDIRSYDARMKHSHRESRAALAIFPLAALRPGETTPSRTRNQHTGHSTVPFGSNNKKTKNQFPSARRASTAPRIRFK